MVHLPQKNFKNPLTNRSQRDKIYMLSSSATKYAGVAESADALASGASDRKVVWVQVPSPAPVGSPDRHKSSVSHWAFFIS